MMSPRATVTAAFSAAVLPLRLGARISSEEEATEPEVDRATPGDPSGALGIGGLRGRA